MTANFCCRVGEQEEAKKDFEALLLCGGAGIGGTSGGV